MQVDMLDLIISAIEYATMDATEFNNSQYIKL